MVAVQTVYKELATLSSIQLQNVYSYVCRLKQQQQLPETENIEPFANEQEAIDFVNDYAERMLNAEG